MGEKRTIWVAAYFVATPEEAEEFRQLAALAGYERKAELVFDAVDAKLAELRERFGAVLAAAKSSPAAQ